MWKKNAFCLGLILVVSSAYAQIGIFTTNTDVGDTGGLGPGIANFEDGTYTMDALGATIGRRSYEDAFHFVYSEISGSFSIEGDPMPILPDGEGGLMIRQDLDPDSMHASWLRVGENVPGGNTNAAYGSVFPHFRTLKGGGTIVDGDVGDGFNEVNVGPIKLERIGNSVHFYTTNDAGEWNLVQSEVIPMSETVYTGLAATANGADALGQFEFVDVAIEEFPLWVERSIPVDDWNSGAEVEVTVTAKASESVDAVVNEVVPRLSGLSGVSVSGGEFQVNEDKGEIDWTLSDFSGEATLTYTVTLPERMSGAWQGTFSDGIHLESYIGGDCVLPKNPSFNPEAEPVELDPEKPVIIQFENGRPRPDNDVGYGLMLDPRSESGIISVNVSGQIDEWMEFPINIPAGYGDLYIYGMVRGEDGNSDSFFVDVEFEPVNEDLTIWDCGSGKSLHIDWVNNRLGEDPRPFVNMTEGENIVYIAPREDSTSIDWFGITNDPDFNIGALDILTGEIINPLEVLEDYDTTNLGIFEASQDVYEVDNPDNLGAEGGAGYDPDTGTYVVIGSGNDVWGTADNFHFLYRELSGDFILDAELELDPGTSTHQWVKGMLMARQELEPESVNFATRQRPDGQYSSQWRLAFGDSSSSTAGELRVTFPTHDGRFRLERIGDQFNTYYREPGSDELVLVDGQEVPMEDPIYVGLAVTAHQAGSLSVGYFRNVNLVIGGEPVPVENWSLY